MSPEEALKHSENGISIVVCITISSWMRRIRRRASLNFAQLILQRFVKFVRFIRRILQIRMSLMWRWSLRLKNSMFTMNKIYPLVLCLWKDCVSLLMPFALCIQDYTMLNERKSLAIFTRRSNHSISWEWSKMRLWFIESPVRLNAEFSMWMLAIFRSKRRKSM